MSKSNTSKKRVKKEKPNYNPFWKPERQDMTKPMEDWSIQYGRYLQGRPVSL